MTPARRVAGLQVWLVAALLAVGVVASLAVLLVVLPTLESSVKGDRAKQEASNLRQELEASASDAQLSAPVDSADLVELAQQIRASTGAEVAIDYRGPVMGFGGSFVTRSPAQPYLLPKTPALQPGQSAILPDEAGVAAAALLPVSGFGTGRVTAALPLTGVAPELTAVRQRVIAAMIVVLLLSSLAGIAIARVLGGRIRGLARTAALIAGGDLSARAPAARIAPQELATLGEGINGMAARLQSLVAEITRERDRDRAMIGSLAEGVLAVDPDGAVVVANDAASGLLGLGAGVESARLEALPPAILDAVLAARATGDAAVDRRTVVLDDGAELEVTVAPLAGEHRSSGTVLTLRDVTDARRLERARRDLVANVSHELKTPIAALKGFLELLEGDVSERHRREFLTSMTQETDRLERLVEEQLQLARLDAGALPLERERVDLAELAEVVVAPRIPLAARAGVTLRARAADDAAVDVDIDAARVEQILLILLDNALRHTPSGGTVEVVVGRDGHDATMAVHDTGEGIPEDAQPFVFDRFYRGDPSREGRSAGLGLAIARGLAEAHRGGIDLASSPGDGSTFTVRLPLPEAGPVTEEMPVAG
ncbi:MAG TPA: ATP-binding protein [Miltoncostaeaceae bacterium]|nr:ATP-binding protein [Miltoncostaeaceae bacterium]